MCHRLPCRPRWNEGDDFAHKLSRYASERSRSFLNGPSRWSSHCATHESGNGERAHRQLWVPLTILCFKLDPLQSEMGDVLLLVKERKHWVFALSKRFSNFWKWTPQETVVIYSSILKVLMAEVSCFEKHKKKKKIWQKGKIIRTACPCPDSSSALTVWLEQNPHFLIVKRSNFYIYSPCTTAVYTKLLEKYVSS